MSYDFVVVMGESFDELTSFAGKKHGASALYMAIPSATELPVFLPFGIMVNNG